MKARPIISRPTFYSAKELKPYHFYRCEKFNCKKLTDESFWYGAIVWRWERDFSVEGIGTFRMGDIAATIYETLYPSVRFDDEFRFVEITEPITVNAFNCRFKKCEFHKHIKIAEKVS